LSFDVMIIIIIIKDGCLCTTIKSAK
jgi:hypothetical protein